jgi:hypothetical protein
MSQLPTTADLQAAIKKTLTSAAFAKFMGDVVQSTLTDISTQRDDMLLLAASTLGKARFTYSGEYITYDKRSADNTHEFYLQCQPFTDDPKQRGKWYGHESRTDQHGNEWRRLLKYHVVDDFGNLVAVPA